MIYGWYPAKLGSPAPVTAIAAAASPRPGRVLPAAVFFLLGVRVVAATFLAVPFCCYRRSWRRRTSRWCYPGGVASFPFAFATVATFSLNDQSCGVVCCSSDKGLTARDQQFDSMSVVVAAVGALDVVLSQAERISIRELRAVTLFGVRR